MGYQPKAEDLDYPARLERLAASTPRAPPEATANLLDAENDDVNVRPLFTTKIASKPCNDGLTWL